MLLVDLNLPMVLARQLNESFSGSVHVTYLAMERSTDIALWQMTHHGFPPRLIWVRTGNVSTAFLLGVFQKTLPAPREFIENPEVGYLEML